MRTVSAFRRAGVSVVLALVFALAHPGVASAKVDWLGWLEEFSGPGPYSGKELSAEIFCFSISERRGVLASDIRDAFPRLKTTADEIKRQTDALDQEARRLLPLEESRDLTASLERFRLQLDDPKITASMLEESLGGARSKADGVKMTNQFKAVEDAVELRRQAVSQAALGASLGGVGGVKGFKSKTNRAHTVYRWSCREAQAALELEREADRSNTDVFARLGFESSAELATEAQEQDARRRRMVIVARRDWQTGIVVSAGRYYSKQNGLLDPNNETDDEAQVRFIPLELMAHHKLSPAIDVGAGVGLALFRALEPAPQEHATGHAFYVVPLSVVVRPFRLFTDKRWGNAVGYRVAVRHFGDLDASNFGFESSTSSFKRHGDFVWGASAFFDLVNIYGAIFQRGKD